MAAVGDELIVFGGYLECFDSTQFPNGCDNVWYGDTYRFGVAPNGKQGTWTRSAVPGPSARGFHGQKPYRDSVILFGGGRYGVLLADLEIYGDMWRYFPPGDPEGERWEPVVQLDEGPGARLGAGMEIIGDDLYLFGGLSPLLLSDETVEPGGFVRHNDVWVFHLDSPDPAMKSRWELLVPDSPLDDGQLDDGQPDIRYIAQFTASADQSRIYLFGGNELLTGAQRNDLWSFELATNSWIRHTPPPDSGPSTVGRTHGASGAYQESFVVTMGDRDDEATECDTNEPSAGQKPTNQTWRFAAPTLAWTHVAPVDPIHGPPPPLKRVAYSQTGDVLFVWGGFDYVCDANAPGESGPRWNVDVWALDLSVL